MIQQKVYRNEDKEKLLLDLNNFNFSVLSFDTETTSLIYSTQKLDCISICDGENAWVIEYPLCKSVLDKMKDSKILIGHNIIFDIKVLHKYGYDYYNCEWIDTMVMAHLINENDSKGLKHLAKVILGKDDVISYEEASKLSRDTFLQYSINDAIYTYELAQYFRPLLEQQRLTKLFKNIEMPFLKTLAKMEINGVLIDKDKVVTIKEELNNVITELQIQMLTELKMRYDMQYDLFGNIKVVSPVNFNSTEQLCNILFNKYKLEPIEKTESGNLSVGKVTIETYKKTNKFVEFLHKYKQAEKLLNGFFEPMLGFVDEDGRIRPHYNDIGTATGRLSCSKPNLQQLPKDNKDLKISTRSCFIAPKGKKMIAIDYSQQELRIMAQLSKDEKLIKIINEGGDLHLINANNVFSLGIPEEKLYSGHPEYNEVKDAYKKERGDGKIFSFGVSYGMGEHKLSRDFKVSLAEAEIFLDKFFKGFPGLKQAMDKTHQMAEKNTYVSTYTGRRRRFDKNQWGKLDSKSLRQSFNFLIQSMGADLIRVACIKIDKYSQDNPDYEVKLIMTVHDELVIEVNEKYAELVAKDCEELMKSCAKGFICPLEAESGIGDSYDACK